MEENISLTPINFFQLSIDCRPLPLGKEIPALTSKNYTKYLLPDVSGLTKETSFADVALGWSPEGLELYAFMRQPYLKSSYPQYEKGDSLEVCIDTRDVKTSGYNTRFCHHFIFLPEPVEGLQAAELTKFRTEDTHELCSPVDLKVKSTLKTDHYVMDCFIPAHCLHGYDPEQFDRIGFTYRINRPGGASQHFTVLSEEYKFQEQPSLWASVRLVR